jgi:hypothetical protein
VALDRNSLKRTRRDYLISHYMALHVTVVSVALGVAGVAAVSVLVAKGLSVQDRGMLGLLWLASLLATATVYAGAMVGAFVLPSQLPSLLDLATPLLLAVTEFLLFAILISQSATQMNPVNAATLWFFSLAALGVVAIAAILRARYIVHHGEYAPDATSAISSYKRDLIRDCTGAGATSLLAVAGGLVHLVHSKPAPLWTYVFGGAITLMFLVSLYSHDQTAKKWRSLLT